MSLSRRKLIRTAVVVSSVLGGHTSPQAAATPKPSRTEFPKIEGLTREVGTVHIEGICHDRTSEWFRWHPGPSAGWLQPPSGTAWRSRRRSEERRVGQEGRS